MKKIEHDFLTWRSFPSSLKTFHDEGWAAGWVFYPLPVPDKLPVNPGATIRWLLSTKQQNIVSWHSKSHLRLYGWDGSKWIDIFSLVGGQNLIALPEGTFDWSVSERTFQVPSGITMLRGFLAGGAGTLEALGITWFDDLKIYQDGVLIYSNDFSKWDPVIGAGVGAPIGGVAGYLLREPLGPMVSEVVGAVLGGTLGGGIGLLTALGIIPVPQIPIPTFGATPEEPGASMRLGKYQVTG